MLKFVNIFIVGVFILFGLANIISAKNIPSAKNWNQEENILTNGGFEDGKSQPDFWNKPIPKKGESFECLWDDKTAFQGNRSLYIKVSQPAGRSIQWTSKRFKVRDGTLQGRLYMKTAISKNGKNIGDSCRGLIHFFDAEGQYKGNRQLAVSVQDHDWKKYEFSAKVPKDATEAFVGLGALGTRGEIWFDNITMNYKVGNTSLVSDMLSVGPLNADIPLIIPQPYQEKYGNESYSWTFNAASLYSENPDSNAAVELKQFLKKIGVNKISINANSEKPGPIFYLGKLNDEKLKTKLRNKLPSIKHEQAYILEVQNNGSFPQIIILGSDQGQYYGVQSLKQWVKNVNEKKSYRTGFIYDKPAFKRRGLVSGTHSLRRLGLMAEHKWNFIYIVGAPHSSGWFKGLSDGQKKLHKEFLEECRARFIDPVPSIHPGYYRKTADGEILGKPLKFTDESLFNGMMDHFRDLYDLGYREFSLAWDDMGRFGGQDNFLFEEDRKKYSSIAKAQRIFTEKTYTELKKIDKNIKLWTIPMAYWLDHSDYEKNHLQEFSKLPKDITFISCGALNKKEMDYHQAIAGRKAIIWDNYVGAINSEFVEPYKIHTGAELEDLTDTYMFPLYDKSMLWDIVSDYMWKGRLLDPSSSARRSIAVIIGAKYADLIQKTVATVQRLKTAPIIGKNSKERIVSVDKLMVQLKDYKNKLQKKVNKKISQQFVKEIREIERKLKLYRNEFQNRELPVKVPFLKKPPIIDGIINEEWKNTTEFSQFRQVMKSRKNPELAVNQTKVYMGWTENKLYLAFKCYEPEIDKIKAVIRKRDEGVYHDDCVEMFFDPDKNGAYYYHIAVNSIGTIYDYYVNKEPWNGSITVKTKTSADSWILEMSISFASMNRNVKPGDTWNFNFCRERYAGKPEFSSWALLMNRFHEPQNFWMLEFVE